jgi:hypothetical protein
MHIAAPKKIVLLGMISQMPVAGVVWQTMHYLVGLRRLGYDVYYVESHARTPTMLMESETDDSAAKAARLIASIAARFDFKGKWAFHALHDDGQCYGMTWQQLKELYASADLLINMHGGTKPLPEHYATGRLVYLETDPVQLQIELHEGNPETVAFLEPHAAFFTFGENYGRSDCRLPVSPHFKFHSTRQPIVLDFWEAAGKSDSLAFTTVGNWRQPWRVVRLGSETYRWSKHLEFSKFLEVPARTGARFELALGQYTADDKKTLESKGWLVCNAPAFTMDLDAYRDYIAGSRGEFTVAKDQNVRLRSGWFSDRSATYLAAGRPVITQDTGFNNVLPTGEGLFSFTSLDDVVEAVEKVNGNYAGHRRAARDIARAYFDADVVLSQLLSALDVGPLRGSLGHRSAGAPKPSVRTLIPEATT